MSGDSWMILYQELQMVFTAPLIGPKQCPESEANFENEAGAGTSLS